MATIYQRSPEGVIEYLGENHMSKQATLDDRFGMIPAQFRDEPETVEMTGWPHSQVEWYGFLGFGVKKG